jgi:hypothetical protein
VRIDATFIIIILVTMITVAGFVIAAINYNSSETYPPWVHGSADKPAIIYVPVQGGNTSLTAALYDAYGNLLVNLTETASNSSYVTFTTGQFTITHDYAYKVWVPQQNTTYDFGLQPPSIGQLKAQYYYVTLNPTMVDPYWHPSS